jgi:hypothetical protein
MTKPMLCDKRIEHTCGTGHWHMILPMLTHGEMDSSNLGLGSIVGPIHGDLECPEWAYL